MHCVDFSIAPIEISIILKRFTLLVAHVAGFQPAHDKAKLNYMIIIIINIRIRFLRRDEIPPTSPRCHRTLFTKGCRRRRRQPQTRRPGIDDATELLIREKPLMLPLYYGGTRGGGMRSAPKWRIFVCVCVFGRRYAKFELGDNFAGPPPAQSKRRPTRRRSHILNTTT